MNCEIEYKIITDRLNKKYPFGCIVTKETCPPIKALVEQGEAVRITKKERCFDVGVQTKEVIFGWKDVASDRIRAEWIVDENKNFEIYRDDTDYKTIIFHHYNESALYGFNGKKIYDICDMFWEQDENIINFANKMDLIVVANEELKKELKKKVKVPIVVIGDGHKLNNKLNKYHSGTAKTIVWFGYSQNFHCVVPFKNKLKKYNIKFKVISDNKIPEMNFVDEFVKWEYFKCQEEIFNSDIAFLPFNNKYKTNNKDITALLCGVPVAKTIKDIERLMSAKERNKDIRLFDFSPFDIKDMAKEYQKLCVEY